MQSNILHLFTRTPLHVGAGSSVGAIDQPVQRERHTGFPIIPGSSMKGVLRDFFRRHPDCDDDQLNHLFGRGDSNEAFTAGKLLFAEARLLAFPVRSAKGSFALLTSPLALRRYARDAGLNLPIPEDPGDMHCLASDKVTFLGPQPPSVILEEYKFNRTGDFPADWQDHLSGLLDDAVLQGAKGRWVLVSDGDLSHFAVHACQVQQHVRIDHETGTSQDGGLFNEETVPSETFFYSVLTRTPKAAADNPVHQQLGQETLVQFGGNGTTGLGFCTIKLQS